MRTSTVTLGKIAKISSGGTPDRDKSFYWGGDIPWVKTTQIQNCFIDADDVDEWITQDGLKNSSAKMVKKGTILMAMYGQGKTRGQVAILGLDATVNQACAAIELDAGISRDYVYQQLLFRYNAIRALSNTGSQENLNAGLIREIAFPLPVRVEQDYVANLLSNWDDAIEKIERLIALRARQKAWILTQVIAAIGQTAKLGHFLKQVSRPVPKPTEPYWALGIRSHGKGTFQRFVKDPSSVDMEELYALNRDNLIVNITFAWEGAIAFVKPEDERCLVSHRFPTYEVNREIADPFFVKYIVNCKAFFSQLALISPGGAGRNRVLNKKDFLKLEVSLPPLAEQKRLAQILATTDLLIEKETSLLAALKSQKRGLMQKLLTGQWRVPIESSKVTA